MNVLALCLVSLLAQAPSPAPASGTPGPTKATLQIGENGWPVLLDEPEPGAVGTAPAAATPTTPRPAARPNDLLGARQLRSPLHEVWSAIGQPSAFRELGGAQARVELHVYDPGDRRAGTRHLQHDADLGRPNRDRLAFAEGRKKYGRNGPSAWATIDGVVWHSREREARELLEVLGLLLRVPWVFDDDRFTVEPKEPVPGVDPGRVRIVIRRRPERPADLVGPNADSAPQDEFELWCDARSMLPLELVVRWGGSGTQRRVQLLEYQKIPPGLLVPVRRVVVDERGQRLLEIEIATMQCRLDLPDDTFRPRWGS
ncbi:MAG: hypothetical protein AAF628_11345 [Planctomycetota bacterium]